MFGLLPVFGALVFLLGLTVAERGPLLNLRGPLLNLPEASAYLGVAVQTLYEWRARGFGPPSFKVANKVRYRLTALDEWLAEQEAIEADRLARIAG